MINTWSRPIVVRALVGPLPVVRRNSCTMPLEIATESSPPVGCRACSLAIASPSLVLLVETEPARASQENKEPERTVHH
jgi:hypothetical protein